jgi:hypothetical protein
MNGDDSNVPSASSCTRFDGIARRAIPRKSPNLPLRGSLVLHACPSPIYMVPGRAGCRWMGWVEADGLLRACGPLASCKDEVPTTTQHSRVEGLAQIKPSKRRGQCCSPVNVSAAHDWVPRYPLPRGLINITVGRWKVSSHCGWRPLTSSLKT